MDVPIFLPQDYLTIGFGQPRLDSQQDWILNYSREENGVTSLRFYRQRQTNDSLSDHIIQVKLFFSTVMVVFVVSKHFCCDFMKTWLNFAIRCSEIVKLYLLTSKRFKANV